MSLSIVQLSFLNANIPYSPIMVQHVEVLWIRIQIRSDPALFGAAKFGFLEKKSETGTRLGSAGLQKNSCCSPIMSFLDGVVLGKDPSWIRVPNELKAGIRPDPDPDILFRIHNNIEKTFFRASSEEMRI
jgi:hypothetical protein